VLHADVDIAEEWERLDVTILVHGIVGHVHVSLADGLALDTTKINILFLGVVFDNFDDGKSIDGRQMSVSSISNRASCRRIVVEFHTHSRLLRTLASEDVDSHGLSYFGSTLEHLLAPLVHLPYADNDIAVAHADMLDVSLQLVARQDHPDESDVVAIDNHFSMT
jgi:hypothetical protein